MGFIIKIISGGQTGTDRAQRRGNLFNKIRMPNKRTVMNFTKSLERLLHFVRKIRTLTMLKGNNPTTPVQLVNTEARERTGRIRPKTNTLNTKLNFYLFSGN